MRKDESALLKPVSCQAHDDDVGCFSMRSRAVHFCFLLRVACGRSRLRAQQIAGAACAPRGVLGRRALPPQQLLGAVGGLSDELLVPGAVQARELQPLPIHSDVPLLQLGVLPPVLTLHRSVNVSER